MIIYSTKDALPKNNQYVLAHISHRPWVDIHDPVGNRFWRVVKFRRGLSLAARERLSVDNPRRGLHYPFDEGHNNQRPYNWEEFGPGSFFGQEIDYWCVLPTIEDLCAYR